MSFKPYDQYKESGIHWLGKVPIYWKVASMKHGFAIKLGKMLQPDSRETSEMLVPYVRAATIQWSGIDIDNIKSMWVSPKEKQELALQKGDLLVSEGGDVGRACLWDNELDECCFQNSVNRVRSKEENSTSFAKYWLSALKDKGFIDILCNKSTIAHFTAEKLAATPVVLPSGNEQLAIASFLDRETAKIDALIAEQQRLIELLQEKRQAVISHAVTKGLNPTAPMKDSGVEWLGEVPEHWAVCAVGHRYEVRLGKMLDEKRVTGNYLGPYLRNTDVQWQSINVKELPEMDFEPHEQERYSLREGDLLVCEGGEVGRSAIWEGNRKPCFYQKALHRLRPLYTEQDDCRFQLYLMRMACSKGVFEASSGKATINHLPAESLRRYRFAYPPLEEQVAVTNHLSVKCMRIDALQKEAESLVLALQERRSALISAAVTGQIDVRGLVKAEADEQ